MKLESLLSLFKADTSGDQVSKDAEIRVAPPPRIARPSGTARPPTSTGRADIDQVDISLQATFVMVASQFDPRYITKGETVKMASQLADQNAITGREKEILVVGPRQDPSQGPISDTLPNNLLSGFQDQLARDVGRNDSYGVNSATRAVSILGRIASIRDAIE